MISLEDLFGGSTIECNNRRAANSTTLARGPATTKRQHIESQVHFLTIKFSILCLNKIRYLKLKFAPIKTLKPCFQHLMELCTFD